MYLQEMNAKEDVEGKPSKNSWFLSLRINEPID